MFILAKLQSFVFSKITTNFEWDTVLSIGNFWIQVIRKYGGSRTWIIGVAVDVLGALLMLKAVSQAPVSECFIFVLSPAFLIMSTFMYSV